VRIHGGQGMPKFILLDRDGVINRPGPGGYVTSWGEFEFLEGALEGIRLLTQNDFAPLVVSNQACVGKGLLTSAGLEEITRRLVEEVERHGGRIHGVYYCTHRNEDDCECRKPRPGLLLKAQRDHSFSFPDTFLIGNSETDLQAAEAVGCPALLVSNGVPDKLEELAHRPRGSFRNLHAAARFIVGLGTNLQSKPDQIRKRKRRGA